MDGNGAPRNGRTRRTALAASVLVLNRNYTAIRVVTARRAFILMYKNFAEVIEFLDDTYGSFDFPSWLDFSRSRGSGANGDQFVCTPRLAILIPRVIRLVAYDKVPKREVKFSRRNILARDGNRCQYCARKLPATQLSLDHVVPKSRGGKSTWTNVVAACNPCNTRKGGRMPAEASMRLRNAPVAPRKNPVLLDKVASRQYQLWRHFLREGEMAIDA